MEWITGLQSAIDRREYTRSRRLSLTAYHWRPRSERRIPLRMPVEKIEQTLFLQKITARPGGIINVGLQMLWLRQGRETERPLSERSERGKGRSGPARTFSDGRIAVAKMEKEKKEMSKKNNRINVPEAREAMDKFKMEAASEVGVNLKDGYNGDISAREAGSVGGQMVKKMIESYEKNL